jgi:4-carboxymuconolactone decarboxylase
MVRFPPITPEAMSSEQRAVAAAIAAGPRGSVRGPFVALLHNPALALRIQALGEHVRFGTAVPATLLELAILTVAAHWRCAYEWYAHESLARDAGLAPAIIDALGEGRIPAPMSDEEAMIHSFCRETLRGGAPGDAVYTRATDAYGAPGVLDLLALCGYYSLLAFVLNTARPEIPDNAGTPLKFPPAD